MLHFFFFFFVGGELKSLNLCCSDLMFHWNCVAWEIKLHTGPTSAMRWLLTHQRAAWSIITWKKTLVWSKNEARVFMIKAASQREAYRTLILLPNGDAGGSRNPLTWLSREAAAFIFISLCPVVTSDSATIWAVAHQAPLSMGFSRQEYWSGLPCPPLGDLPNPGIEPRSPTLQADSLLSLATREALISLYQATKRSVMEHLLCLQGLVSPLVLKVPCAKSIIFC